MASERDLEKRRGMWGLGEGEWSDSMALRLRGEGLRNWGGVHRFSEGDLLLGRTTVWLLFTGRRGPQWQQGRGESKGWDECVGCANRCCLKTSVGSSSACAIVMPAALKCLSIVSAVFPHNRLAQ